MLLLYKAHYVASIISNSNMDGYCNISSSNIEIYSPRCCARCRFKNGLSVEHMLHSVLLHSMTYEGPHASGNGWLLSRYLY